MANPVVEWAKDNPLLAAGGALAVVVFVLFATSGSGSDQEEASGGLGAAGVQAYYAAVSNQAQAGAVIQTTQIRANAETNRALIAATYGLEATKVNAGSDQAATAAQVEIARIGGNTQLGIAGIGREVALRRIDADIANNRGQVELAQINANLFSQDLANRSQIARLAKSSRLGKAQRGAVLQAAITGQVVPVTYKPVNPGNSAGAIIGSVGGAVKDISGALLPFF